MNDAPEPDPNSTTSTTGQVNHRAQEAQYQIGPEQPRRRRWVWVVAIVIVVAVIAAVLWYWQPWSSAISTDDAFIAADVAQISARVSGRVQQVHVIDNQRVKTGDLLVQLDPTDFQTAVDQAQADLAAAEAASETAQTNVTLTQATTAANLQQGQAQVVAARATAEQAQAQLDAALSEQQRAQADLNRYEQLQAPAVSQQQRDVVRAAAQRADADVLAAQRAAAAAKAQITVAEGRLATAQAGQYEVQAAQAQAKQAAAAVTQAQAKLQMAKLNLSYAAIEAPSSGRVTSKNVEPGNFVQNGQALMAIVTDNLWIAANFKETQITDMRPGDPATIVIDAYPDHTFNGHVDSIQAGSGAYFSLLPPENATGNFVKVVQRVPVKIVFDDPVDLAKFPIGPGMSVVPKVYPSGP